MRIRTHLLLAALCALNLWGGSLHSAEPVGEASAPAGEGWVQVSTSSKLSVYYRYKKGSPIKEYQAIGVIAAPNWVVENVLADTEAYPNFMPYVAECKVLAREAEGLTTYQRVSAPFISGRDYVLHIRIETRHSKSGTVYVRHWNVDSSRVVAEHPGTIRMKVNEGSWTLEPAGESTRVTYSIFTNPGGSIPTGMLNYANQSVIPKIFAAVEKQSGDKKYRANRPAEDPVVNH